MIESGTLRPRRALGVSAGTLSGRLAMRRALRARARRMQARWPAVLLRWRRLPAPPAASSLRLTRAAVASSWSAAINLHVHLHTAAARHAAALAATRAEGGRLLAFALLRKTPGGTGATARTAAPGCFGRLELRTIAAAALLPPRAGPARHPPAGARTRIAPAAVRAAVRVLQRHPARNEPARAAGPLRAMVQAQRMATPRLLPVRPVVHPLRRKGGLPGPRRDTIALDWRQPVAGQASAASPFASPAAFADGAARAPAGSAPAAPIASAAVPATAAAVVRASAQLAAAALDPALAERLAQDVIRRVERSLRIERERRGH